MGIRQGRPWGLVVAEETTMRLALPLLLCAVLAFTPACRMNERLTGTLMGATGGAVLGGTTTGVSGALVGGLVGAIGGYIVGDYIADRRESGRRRVFTSGGGNSGGGARRAVGGVAHDEARAAYQRGRSALTATEARGHYEESLRLDPRRPEPYNALGVSWRLAGDPARAAWYFEQALLRDPSYTPAQQNLQRLRTEPAAKS